MIAVVIFIMCVFSILLVLYVKHEKNVEEKRDMTTLNALIEHMNNHKRR